MSDYDTDILIWSEHQAELLRRRAAGELVNHAEVDWPNIAEEIGDVGRSELRSCRSFLRQSLRHMLKAEAWPLSRDAPTWRADAIDFRRQARDAFSPSIRRSTWPTSMPTRWPTKAAASKALPRARPGSPARMNGSSPLLQAARLWEGQL
jgi:hypothetical protein